MLLLAMSGKPVNFFELLTLRWAVSIKEECNAQGWQGELQATTDGMPDFTNPENGHNRDVITSDQSSVCKRHGWWFQSKATASSTIASVHANITRHTSAV